MFFFFLKSLFFQFSHTQYTGEVGLLLAAPSSISSLLSLLLFTQTNTISKSQSTSFPNPLLYFLLVVSLSLVVLSLVSPRLATVDLEKPDVQLGSMEEVCGSVGSSGAWAEASGWTVLPV